MVNQSSGKDNTERVHTQVATPSSLMFSESDFFHFIHLGTGKGTSTLRLIINAGRSQFD